MNLGSESFVTFFRSLYLIFFSLFRFSICNIYISPFFASFFSPVPPVSLVVVLLCVYPPGIQYRTSFISPSINGTGSPAILKHHLAPSTKFGNNRAEMIPYLSTASSNYKRAKLY